MLERSDKELLDAWSEGAEWVNTNGMIGLQRTGEEPITCADPDAFEQPAEPWDGFQPDYQGCPVIAPGWADHGFFMQRGDLENPAPGAYLSMGTTDGVAWVEVTFWNLHQFVSSDEGYRISSTRVVRLREDGTFSMRFPIANFTGLEMIGWAHSDGSMEDPLVAPLTIADGDVFEFAPIPALAE